MNSTLKNYYSLQSHYTLIKIYLKKLITYANNPLLESYLKKTSFLSYLIPNILVDCCPCT